MIIDLRSDTVTKPCQKMRQAMAGAEVGDDVFGEDPTVNILQEKVASMLGKEAGLFVASGTMANQIAISTHTRPGDEVILEASSHIFNYEAGACAMISGVQLFPLPGEKGVITSSQIKKSIRPLFDVFPKTRLICLENTHNSAGGTIFPIEEIHNIREIADNNNLKVHLDGARLWNASSASGIKLSEYGKYFDSISVCFSKGLGAPVGSLLAGDRIFIDSARRNRKKLGGGMRQVGILAAAALYALENNIKKLRYDHRHAKELAHTINNIPAFNIDIDIVQTNILYFKVVDPNLEAKNVVDQLKKENILILATGDKRLRAITHLDITDASIQKVKAVFKKLFF